ncbi:MAG TPA: sigma-70 family RNA polymerase sigma factor [Blastocatellia bacterium]|nr:sigma-70 family RNA polymerase sigma factor [Blastocatellia bacterium]
MDKNRLTTDSTSVAALVARSRAGDADAFALLVRRFQDMAVGYGYALLHDFQLAEDAAQEAFFEAYRSLDQLREPAAFAGWFRRIVFKQCDRIIRRKPPPPAPLEAIEVRASGPSQAEALERREMNERVLSAVEQLPEHERATLLLFYISGYSHKEIGAFLDVPVTTVKKRLHDGRDHLRERLLEVFEENLRERRPSRDEAFAARVMALLKAARAGDAAAVKALLESDPRLLAARDPLGNTALILAVNSGHAEVAELLFAAGCEPDVFEAAAIGRTARVAELIECDASLLDSYSPEGFTPLMLAAHFGHAETVGFLIARGANVNAVARHEMRVTALHAALFGRQVETARRLVEAGADVNAQRGGAGWPRAGWTALHYAAGGGFVELIELLVARGARLNVRDAQGRTPLDVAAEEKQQAAEISLRGREQ